MIISFFGHSHFQKTNEYEQIIMKTIDNIARDTSVIFYFGGYGDFDSFAYDCCKKYKKTHPDRVMSLAEN